MWYKAFFGRPAYHTENVPFLVPIASSKPTLSKSNQLHLFWFKPRCRVDFGVRWLPPRTNICDLPLNSFSCFAWTGCCPPHPTRSCTSRSAYAVPHTSTIPSKHTSYTQPSMKFRVCWLTNSSYTWRELQVWSRLNSRHKAASVINILDGNLFTVVRGLLLLCNFYSLVQLQN